ncbi:SH3 domain-binding glutamic acid-rich-like protein 3 isoform X1 [Anneissia japonica]|uniref:SH3 domain-binding glutamic acid-rich-like protein 3 isoform X1 n=1 Tax=Anneissia japonica TaxID=1529436 RepID=UPI00142593B7|nr:SH3 domain-binding glutamic acid-rich-like protein 3 isoform X1 [Anneissia japonica]
MAKVQYYYSSITGLHDYGNAKLTMGLQAKKNILRQWNTTQHLSSLDNLSDELQMKKKQQKIEMILDGKKIAYEKVDIAADEESKKRMRELCGDPKALPPQLCNGDEYCGGYDAFEVAVEDEELEKFLKLA